MSTHIEARVFESLGSAGAIAAACVLIGTHGTTRAQAVILVATAAVGMLPFVLLWRGLPLVWKTDMSCAVLIAAGGVAAYPIGGLGLLAPALLMGGAGVVRLTEVAAERSEARRAEQPSLEERRVHASADARRVHIWGITTAVLAFSAAVLIYSFGLLIAPFALVSAVLTVVLWDRHPRPRPLGAHLAVVTPFVVLSLAVFSILGPLVAALLERIAR